MKTCSEMPTHVMNICGQVSVKYFTKYGDIVAHKTVVNKQRIDGRTTQNIMLFARAVSPQSGNCGGYFRVPESYSNLSGNLLKNFFTLYVLMIIICFQV